jgi:uncharacterized protein YoxC
MSEWSIIKDLITTVGFPIFVSLFFLIKVQRVLELLVDALKNLENSISRMNEETKELSEKINQNYELTQTLLRDRICLKREE